MQMKLRNVNICHFWKRLHTNTRRFYVNTHRFVPLNPTQNDSLFLPFVPDAHSKGPGRLEICDEREGWWSVTTCATSKGICCESPLFHRFLSSFKKLPTVRFSPSCTGQEGQSQSGLGGSKVSQMQWQGCGYGRRGKHGSRWVKCFFEGGAVYFINSECRLALEPSRSRPYGEDVLRL